MAKSNHVNQPLIVRDVSDPTLAVRAPKLYWPRCDANTIGIEAKISRHEKFPFQHLYGVTCSVDAYPKDHLTDAKFLEELCLSKQVIIIQKTFTHKHYSALTNVMKKHVQQGILKTESILIISQKNLGAPYAGNQGAFNVIFNTTLFTHANCDFHDRIVLLDGKIWHFGATVCGMHNTPHAYSGPWIDTDSSLMNFIRKFAAL